MANPQSRLIQRCHWLFLSVGIWGYAVRIVLSVMSFNRTNLVFAVLSIAYINAIFLFADSPAVSAVAVYNPFSLLHIPLYGVLTLLIVLSIFPLRWFHLFRYKGLGDSGDLNDLNGPNALNTPDAINAINSKNRLLIAALVSFIVASADEYHQSFIATREASITDVLLDAVGIALAVWLALAFIKWHKSILKRRI
jgi:hypothetical protein